MINNYLRATIIATARAILPTLALLALAPWLINNKLDPQIGLQPMFLVLHGLLYLGLIILWPKLIDHIQAKNETPIIQLKTALNVRWYLFVLFLCIDTLMLINAS